MAKRKYSFYVYLAFIILIAIGAILIVRPFFTAVAFAAVFAYWLYPLHKKFSKLVKDTPSAVIISVLLFLVLLAFVQYGLFVFIKEIAHLGETLAGVKVGEIFSAIVDKNLATASALKSVVDSLSAKVTILATNLLYSIPGVIVSFFTFILAFFYFLKDGRRLSEWITNNIPFPKKERSKMINGAKNYMDAFLKAQVFIGLLQGLACALGFFLFGLSEYVLIGSLAAALLSVLPIIGPYILYVPIGAVLALQGNAGVGIGLIAYGLAIGSFLDYIIRPELTGKYASMHPLAVLIGVLGGLAVFGLVGIIIGPIILGLCAIVIESLSEYRTRQRKSKSKT